VKLHPGNERLARYLVNRLSTKETDEVLRHLQRPCRRCQAELELLSDVRSAVAGGQLQSAPSELIRLAQAAYRERVRLGLIGGKRRWSVELLYDSLRTPQLAGARGSSIGRQLLYRIGDLDLDLRLQEGGLRHRSLNGQVLRRDPESASVAFSLRVAGKRKAAHADVLGQFQLTSLPTAAFTLELLAGTQAVARIRLPAERRVPKR